MSPSTTARRLSTLAALLAVAACQDAPPVPTAPGSPDDLAASRAELPEQAQQRREAIFQRATPEVLGIPGAVFIDNDERAGRVVVGISERLAEPAVRAAMRRLGVAEGDYALVATPEIHMAATLRDVFRPTQAGIQIHFSQYVCTLGFNVDHAGGRSFITNSHCTSTQGGTEGTVYYQPASNVDGGVIATEVDDPTYFKGGVCPGGRKCRYSDAARALYSGNVASTRGAIARTTDVNNGSLTIGSTPTFTITSQDNSTSSFATGTVVNKVGRTTGWTRGAVTRTCVNTGVSGSNVVQLCQTFVSDPGGATVVSGGDSGSPVFIDQGSSGVRLVGILWGGSSDNKTFIFSPLKQIQQELGGVVATSDGSGGGDGGGDGGGGGGGGDNCNPAGKNCR